MDLISLDNFDEEYEKSRIKNSEGENVDLFVQKKSEARLIECQGTAHVQNILKSDYLILKKQRTKKI